METGSDLHVYSTPLVKVSLIIYDSKGKNGPCPKSNLCFQLQRSKMLVHLSSY